MAVSTQYQESKNLLFLEDKVHAENWRILINKEIYAIVKKPTITEAIRLKRLRWFGHVQRMEENRIPRKVLYKGWIKSSGNSSIVLKLLYYLR